VHPVARWIWLMRDLAGPALVEGQADSPVEFVKSGSGKNGAIQSNPTNGQFRVMLPEGKYTVRCQQEQQTRIFLPAGTYRLDLRAGQAMDFEISALSLGDGEVRIRLSAHGEGTHRFNIRTDNLAIRDGPKELVLKRESVGTVDWFGRITSPDTPWVAVVIADEDPTIRKELLGAAWEP
jgi:hypothetical protein